MDTNPFNRLAPFIQEFIYREKWQRMHKIQVEAITAVLDTSNHILISSATASGKTEAALLPIITDLYNNPPTTIGAMYIGPLKALINDQFERLNALLDETDIPVQSWHGDVSQSKKARFLRRSQGILQITPESLESMLMYRHHELSRLFSALRYVIIDEIHAFIDSDRGRQVMCQLERLAHVQNKPARRIGLSATLGEPELTMQWMQGNSAIPVSLITGTGGGKVELGLEYFILPAEEEEDNETNKPNEADGTTELDTTKIEELLAEEDAFYEHLHWMTQRVPKTLIFANRRSTTEDIVIHLRELSEKKRLPNYYHVHHGSISAALRESAEEAMRDDTKPSSVAATITLELGIDIGQLDQVLQVNSTFSVSSFVQRLGRSGRRGDKTSRMFFYSTDTDKDPKHLGDELPWNLLQTIAIIQLYIEEKWIEPPKIPSMPLSLLYHQTMSTIKSHTELTPSNLAQRILTLSPFKGVTQDQFRRLLHHLIEIEHLEQTEIGGLIIGVAAERIVNNYRFFATFEDDTTFRVRNQSREIGTIQSIPEVNSTIGLAGYTWQVLDVDHDKQIIFVKKVRGKAQTIWSGSGIQIHTRILQKIREILLSNTQYNYLHTRARKRLQITREYAKRIGITKSSLVPLAPNRFLVLPWCGTRQFVTQILLLKQSGIKIANDFPPYYYEVIHDVNMVSDLQSVISNIVNNPLSLSELANGVHDLDLKRYKYDQYIPAKLLREAYASDYLDINGSIQSLNQL